jgi:predicted nucleic acid-binding protein
MTYLLDVNVLLAFAYNAQQSHLRVLRWIEHIDSHGLDEPPPFASCSIVELGFIRVASGTARLAENLTVARADLRRVKSILRLRMLGDELDGNHLPEWVTKAGQTTDGHLLELATCYNAKFATLDSRIPGALLIPEYFGNPDEVREPHVAYGAVA